MLCAWRSSSTGPSGCAGPSTGPRQEVEVRSTSIPSCACHPIATGLASRAALGQHGAMDLTYPPEAEAFRKEIRTWLEENLPRGWFEPGFELQGEERAEFNRQWPAKL